MTKKEWAILLKEQEQSQDEEEDKCAWCMVEEGEELGEGSHGICHRHAEEEYQQYKARRAS